MTAEVSELLKKAPGPATGGTRALAGSLLESLDESWMSFWTPQLKRSGGQNIALRVAELDSGKVKPVPWGRRVGKIRSSSVAARALEIHPSARQALKFGLSWYLERNETAALKFATELDRAIELLIAAPQRWPPGEHGSRKYCPRARATRYWKDPL